MHPGQPPPTTVCSSSIIRMTSPQNADFSEPIETFLEFPPGSGYGDHGAPSSETTRLPEEDLGHIVAASLRQTFHDGVFPTPASRSEPGCSWCAGKGSGSRA